LRSSGPKLDGFTDIIDAWLDGARDVHRKQHHTANRVFDLLCEEQGYTGGYRLSDIEAFQRGVQSFTAEQLIEG